MGRHFSLNQGPALLLARGYVKPTENSTLSPKAEGKVLCKDNLGGQFAMGEMGLSRKTGQVAAGESNKKSRWLHLG